MRFSRVFVLAMLAITSAALSQTQSAALHADRCEQQRRSVAIENTQSLSELSKLHAAWNNTTELDLFFAYRAFELQKSPETAANLIQLTPRTEEQEMARYMISGHNCHGLTDQDSREIDLMYDGLPRLLRQAVMIAPKSIDRYVSYALLATMDVHSDYTNEMVAVCRAFHSQFVEAVSRLPNNDRNQMTKHLFDAGRCKSLFNQEE